MMNLVSEIGDLVDEAVETITGKVDGVRNAAKTPCYKYGILSEALINRRNQYRTMVGTVAAYEEAGQRAVTTAINNMGRPSSTYLGGKRFAAHLYDTAIPTPPPVVAAGIFGGPAAAGIARNEFIQWLDNRLGTGRPAGSLAGSKLFGTVYGVRLYQGKVRGPAVREAYDQWVIQESNAVYPPGKEGWRNRVANATARLVPLGDLLIELEEEAEQWEQLCIAENASERDRIDREINAGISDEIAKNETERIKAFAPIAIAGLVAIGLIRRSR